MSVIMIILIVVLTARVIRLRPMPEESIRQVFIPGDEHDGDHIHGDLGDYHIGDHHIGDHHIGDYHTGDCQVYDYFDNSNHEEQGRVNGDDELMIASCKKEL